MQDVTAQIRNPSPLKADAQGLPRVLSLNQPELAPKESLRGLAFKGYLLMSLSNDIRNDGNDNQRPWVQTRELTRWKEPTSMYSPWHACPHPPQNTSSKNSTGSFRIKTNKLWWFGLGTAPTDLCVWMPGPQGDALLGGGTLLKEVCRCESRLSGLLGSS